MAGQICPCQECSLWQPVCFDEKVQTFVQSGQTHKIGNDKKKKQVQTTPPHSPLIPFGHSLSLHEVGEEGHIGLPVPLCPLSQFAHHVRVARGGGQQQ